LNEYNIKVKTFSSFELDAFMVQTEDLVVGNYRLLETSDNIVFPVNTHIRLLITASDVIHS
jgi:heme/copper-type cytochrome/quinol oxidase subunit 2